MSTFDWLQANNYPLLLLMFVRGMVPYGYGDVTEVPVVRLYRFWPDTSCTCVVDLYASILHTGYFTCHEWSTAGLHNW